MLNVRLSEEEENKVKEYAQDHEVTKTQVVREALSMYFAKKDANAYETGKDLFGVVGGGNSRASVDYKAHIKKSLGEKHAH